MDSLGLLSSILLTSNLRVLTAGASISAPAEAQLAIVILPPVDGIAGSETVTYPSQVGMCTKDKTIRFAHPGYGIVGYWSWDTTSVTFKNTGATHTISVSSMIYLG